MQIKHWKSLVSSTDGINRISALVWSPNHQKLAIATADKVISLYDETGERKDRFATKPADPQKVFIIHSFHRLKIISLSHWLFLQTLLA
jgi:hypothetical protein